jgi:hypothetical protein
MKKVLVMTFMLMLTFLLCVSCSSQPTTPVTNENSVGEGVYPPLVMYQNELYITSPNPPDMYPVDEGRLTQVGVIETTISASPPSGIPTENFRMVGHGIYIKEPF